jgi:hypothetical protein
MTLILASLMAIALSVSSGGGPNIEEGQAGLHSGPALSSLAPGCSLKVTMGPEWRRLWVDCGGGAFRVTEPEALATHVRIRTPEQALEFLRLFTASSACDLVPDPPWVEVEASDKDGWFVLGRERFDRLCGPAKASKLELPGAAAPAFRVERCTVSTRNGALYHAEDYVTHDGFVTEARRKILLPAAGLGSCGNAFNADRR